VDIDKFNTGLHIKRPKFIGKRGVEFTSACRQDPLGNCIGDDEGDSGVGDVTTNKRGPRRKFMGKKSSLDAAAVNNFNDVAQRATRGRKFVGKRGQRKFMGRRSDANTNDITTRLSRQLDNKFTSSIDKRARRKFVG